MRWQRRRILLLLSVIIALGVASFIPTASFTDSITLASPSTNLSDLLGQPQLTTTSVEDMLQVETPSLATANQDFQQRLQLASLLRAFPGYHLPGHSSQFDPSGLQAIQVISFDEALRQTNQFAAQYGVRVVLASCSSKVTEPYHATCLDDTQKNSYEVKSNLETIAQVLMKQPVTLPNAIGWQTIVLSGPLKADEAHTFGVGGYARGTSEVVIDSSIMISPNVISHEESHLIDRRTSSMAHNAKIPSYSALNVTSRYAGSYNVSQSFYASQPPSMQDVSSSLTVSPAANDPATAQYAASEEYSRYALVSEAEDIAETGSLILNGSATDLYSGRSPVLRAKSINFLQRLQLISPESVRYLTYQARIQSVSALASNRR